MKMNEIIASDRIKRAKEATEKAFRKYVVYRQKSFEKIDSEKLKIDLRKIKENSISNLEKLKNRAVENLEAQGIKVFEAKDAKKAREIILKLIPKNEKIVKSKSNVIAEIELN
ncbi:MAG: LUD domain-containing protein, partial [Candidatus Aenigmatarchaeota archaeon]